MERYVEETIKYTTEEFVELMQKHGLLPKGKWGIITNMDDIRFYERSKGR